MPVLDMASYSAKHAGIDSKYDCRSVSPADRTFTGDPASTKLTPNLLMDMLTIIPEDHPSALSTAAGDALLNINGVSSRTTSDRSTPVRYSEGGASALLDILAVGEQNEYTSVPQTSAFSRRPSALEELLSNPVPDHRLSILELEPQCLHGTPLDEDVPMTSYRTSLAQSALPSRRSSAPTFEMPLRSTQASVASCEPTTSQQRVYLEPTLAEQKKTSLNDARLQSRQGSYTESSILQQRRSFLRGEALISSDFLIDETWPSASQQRKVKEDSALRISRFSFHSEASPAHLPLDEFPQEGSRVSVQTDQSKGSGLPFVDIWPTAAQQREIQEDSTLRISRLSSHGKPTPAQLPIDEWAQSGSPVSVHINQSEGSRVPVVGIWPTETQQRDIQEDSALRISRLSFHPKPTPTEIGRSDEFPPASSRLIIHDNQSQLFTEKRNSDNVPPIVALQTQGLKVAFEFTKDPESPQTTVIKALFSNTSTISFTDFIFRAAVPKYMTLKLDPASSSVIPPNSNGKVSQVLTVTNSTHSQKTLIMRLRISYKVDGQPILEEGQVDHFPPNL